MLLAMSIFTEPTQADPVFILVTILALPKAMSQLLVYQARVAPDSALQKLLSGLRLLLVLRTLRQMQVPQVALAQL